MVPPPRAASRSATIWQSTAVPVKFTCSSRSSRAGSAARSSWRSKSPPVTTSVSKPPSPRSAASSASAKPAGRARSSAACPTAPAAPARLEVAGRRPRARRRRGPGSAERVAALGERARQRAPHAARGADHDRLHARVPEEPHGQRGAEAARRDPSGRARPATRRGAASCARSPRRASPRPSRDRCARRSRSRRRRARGRGPPSPRRDTAGRAPASCPRAGNDRYASEAGPQSLITARNDAAPAAASRSRSTPTARAPRRARQHALVLQEAARPVEPVPVADRVERIEEPLVGLPRAPGARRRAAR